MKKIGILHGKESSFPEAFVARVNSKNVPGIIAEPVQISKAIRQAAKPIKQLVKPIKWLAKPIKWAAKHVIKKHKYSII